eukprot:6472015-Amphidinium_carterae.1
MGMSVMRVKASRTRPSMSAAHGCVMVGWSARSKCTCIASTESRIMWSATCSPPWSSGTASANAHAASSLRPTAWRVARPDQSKLAVRKQRYRRAGAAPATAGSMFARKAPGLVAGLPSCNDRLSGMLGHAQNCVINICQSQVVEIQLNGTPTQSDLK